MSRCVAPQNDIEAVPLGFRGTPVQAHLLVKLRKHPNEICLSPPGHVAPCPPRAVRGPARRFCHCPTSAMSAVNSSDSCLLAWARKG